MSYQTPPYTPRADVTLDERSSRKRRAVGDIENEEGTVESIGNSMGITFDKAIFKNPLKSGESATLEVKSNLRKKLASVFSNKYYFTIDDGKIYLVQDLPMDFYFPSKSNEVKVYDHYCTLSKKAQIVHAGWRMKFVEGQHSTEIKVGEATEIKKQHGDIKIYMGETSDVTECNLPSDDVTAIDRHLDCAMLEEVQLTGDRYNSIARWKPSIKVPGDVYNKTVLKDSRCYRPDPSDLKRMIKNDTPMARLLPTCDPATDGNAIDRIAWQIKETLLPAPVSILKIDPGNYTIYCAERIKRNNGEDCYILSMYLEEGKDKFKRIWCPIVFQNLLIQNVN
ncbi:uncharacterized protein LOC134773432 [Penaeus indicus]|uniref:uncharacterized protein LOC134773432 n=1 Tax=Penaeus indicus TaxID=29960 RepID=UPI00300C48C6